ncbi:alpha/beta fold hydrolase [Ideonella sp. DXS29W]|uniref:Alpha/beta fold hydrolase n=1 Tax=Ideonella lacteola TaxID=2984193 RepID=A0ABU9BKC1_9BURK
MTTAPSPIALVLLPGMDGTGDLFEPFLAAWGPATPVQVLRYPLDRAAGYDELIAFAREALPTQHDFVLVGESFSGPIAMALAAEAPPHLAGLVLCCTFSRWPLPWFRGFAPLLRWWPWKPPLSALAWCLLGDRRAPAWRARLSQAMAKVSIQALRARALGVLTVDQTAALARVPVPVLYLRALHDRVVPRSAWRHVAHTRPDAQCIELPGPHFLLQVEPLRAAQAIRAFVDRLPRRREARS